MKLIQELISTQVNEASDKRATVSRIYSKLKEMKPEDRVFEAPNYVGVPKNLQSKLTSEFVDAVQHYVPEIDNMTVGIWTSRVVAKMRELGESRKDMMVKGWRILDKSFVTKGADPTQVGKYILSKNGTQITVEEFFGDWSVSDNKGFSSKRDLNSKQVDQLLQQYGAPSLDDIAKFIDKEYYYHDDPFGGRDPMGDASP